MLRRCGFFPAAANTYAGCSRCPACEPLLLTAPGSNVFRNIRNAPRKANTGEARRVAGMPKLELFLRCRIRRAQGRASARSCGVADFSRAPRNLHVLIGVGPDKHQLETRFSQRPSSTLR